MGFTQLLELIIVLGRPVEHYRLIIGGENDVFCDSGQSFLVLERVQEIFH